MAEKTPATEVATTDTQSMYNRWSGWEKKVNVMDEIHSLKIYNAQPGKDADPSLANQLMIKAVGNDKYEVFDISVNMNILKINKAINGSYFILDEAGQQVLDSAWEPKRSFAFTEEYFRFSKNTSEVFFKNNNGNSVTKNTIGNLKTLFKTPEVWGVKNPFHKIALTQNNKTYDASFLKESFVVYGIFTSGMYAWEYFRLFISNAAFGNKWDAQTKTSSIVPDSLADALAVGFNKFNEMKTAQGFEGRFDDSLLVTTLTSVKAGNFFKPTFSNVSVVTEDNAEAFDYINDLTHRYKEVEFNKAAENYAKVDTKAKDKAEDKAEDKAIATTVEDSPAGEEVKQNEAEANEGISIEDIPF